jgi:alkanesulfonate monooxygenase SsuD/methylene tetrahydromethanopterin reductase-like flavin-dependent oxidoreductase (luciferase family)
LKRVATHADAWLPVGIPLSGVGAMFDGIKNMAKEAGRDPSVLELIITAGVEIHKTAIEKDRVEFTGTPEQIGEDFAAAKKLGAAEITTYAQFLPSGETAEDLVTRMETLWTIAKQA